MSAYLSETYAERVASVMFHQGVSRRHAVSMVAHRDGVTVERVLAVLPAEPERPERPAPEFEWRAVQRWPSGDEAAVRMSDERAARDRQAILDANTSHPSGYQRRIEVICIERREVGPWEAVA